MYLLYLSDKISKDKETKKERKENFNSEFICNCKIELFCKNKITYKTFFNIFQLFVE